MRLKNLILTFFLVLVSVSACRNKMEIISSRESIRALVDTVGFAQYSWQMDSIMARLGRKGWKKTEGDPWKIVICPHDDYKYVGKLYPELLQNVRASNLILIGVAHRAARLGIEDYLVFDTYAMWKGPWKNVPVSTARHDIYSMLKGKYATISDTLHSVEHSVESMIPFLQYFNRDISIIPILVPAMDTLRMMECGKALADAVREVAEKRKWELGKDYAIIVTTDAVHYGNEDWGGSDYAVFGCDSLGNARAVNRECEIISKCLTGKISEEKIRLFSAYTIRKENYKEYKWTWCGRYSVPVTLYTAYYLNGSAAFDGELVGYSTSISSEHLLVDDLNMGHTAIATNCHWVGYAGIGFR